MENGNIGAAMQSSRAVVFIALATAFSPLGDQMLYSVVPTHYAASGGRVD